MNFEIVTIEKEITVIGLSYQKLGLPATLESLNKMWEEYGNKYRHNVKNTVLPLVDYGINAFLLSDRHEYIAGCSVTEISMLDKNWASFIIPIGKYIKFVYKKMEDMCKNDEDVKIWAKENNILINEDFMVEVYPSGAFEGKEVEIYTLHPIQ